MARKSAQCVLRELMQTGGLVSGEVLDPVEIASRLPFSVDELLLAMANLEAFGLLERDSIGRQYIVRHPEPAEMLRFMHMRLDIEVRVAETLALTATDDDLAFLRCEIELQRKAARLNQKVRFLEASALFHQALAERANFLHGARVLRTWEDYQQVIGMRALQSSAAMLDAVHEHEAFLQLVESRDARGAGEAMKRHLTRTLARLEGAAVA